MVGGAVAPLLITHASEDERFVNHPGLTKLGIESYVAVPLKRRDGSTFGTLCALDPLPADLAPADLETFVLLADLIAFEMEVDEENRRREAVEEERRFFVEAVAHDVKNPLQVIKAQAQLLRRRLQQNRPVTETILEARLTQIEASVDRSTEMINEMLDASRLRVGQPLELVLQLTDLASVVSDTVAPYQQSAGRHTVTLQLGEERVMGMWDRSRITRVLTNLLSNAVRYSPGGGQIAVKVHREEEAAKAWAVLSVKDDGMGIPAEDQAHIFEKYRRGGNVEGRVGGTGIGLAGCKQIIEQHGGSMSVESQEGKGSTFTVRLPI